MKRKLLVAVICCIILLCSCSYASFNVTTYAGRGPVHVDSGGELVGRGIPLHGWVYIKNIQYKR